MSKHASYQLSTHLCHRAESAERADTRRAITTEYSDGTITFFVAKVNESVRVFGFSLCFGDECRIGCIAAS